MNFKINSSNDNYKETDNYIHDFKYERLQSNLNYLVPIQLRNYIIILFNKTNYSL